jgi:hypothetical protein
MVVSRSEKEQIRRLTWLIGEIGLAWNSLEITYQQLIHRQLNLAADIAWLVTGSMGNNTRSDILRAIARSRDAGTEGGEYVEYAVLLFNSCKENRNAVMHSFPTTDLTGYVPLMRVRTAYAESSLRIFENDWDDFERIPYDIEQTEHFTSEMISYLGGNVPSLPEKPPRPNMLSLRHLFARNVPSPPQPSQE